MHQCFLSFCFHQLALHMCIRFRVRWGRSYMTSSKLFNPLSHRSSKNKTMLLLSYQYFIVKILNLFSVTNVVKCKTSIWFCYMQVFCTEQHLFLTFSTVLGGVGYSTTVNALSKIWSEFSYNFRQFYTL